jgi:uncharacterized membrane protein YphA (DoxX/SURF4 family)
MDSWLHAERKEKPADAVKGWIDQVQADFDDRRQEFALHYDLDEKQQKQASQVSGDYQAQVRSWAGRNRDDLENHVHQWRRKETSRQAPDAADLPFRQSRLASSQGELNAQTSGFRAELAAIEGQYENALAGVLTDEQRSLGSLPAPRTAIDSIDAVMTYVILIIGFLLLVGLFTRTASLAGAAFLLSVVMTQPFWVSDAQPTFNQFVELFALLTLATTHVGRWAGLDFFVHHLIFGRDDATKGTSDVSDS